MAEVVRRRRSKEMKMARDSQDQDLEGSPTAGVTEDESNMCGGEKDWKAEVNPELRGGTRAEAL